MEDADYLEREEEAAMRDDAVMNEDTDVSNPAHTSGNNVVISRGTHAAANLDISDPSVQRAIEMLRRSSQSSSGSENPDTADMMRRPMTSRMMSTSSISDILGSSNANPLVSNSMPLLGNMQLSFFPDITMSQQQGYASQQQRADSMAFNLLDILQFPKVFRNLVSIAGTSFQGVVPTLCRRARMMALNFSNASNFEMFSPENTGRSSQMGFQPVQPMQFVPVESSLMTGIVSSSAPLMPQASIVQSSAVAEEEEDYKSVIECGIFHEGKRHLTFNLDYFGQEVEVFTAVSDRFKRILVRPATLAKKLDCSTSRIGMHLHRSENKFRDGIFQAIGYSEKPSFQVKRLRSGAYFVSVDSCKVIEDSFRKRPAQKTFEGSAEANQPRKKSKKSPASGPVQATSSPAEVPTAAVSVGLPAQSFQGIGNPFFFPTSQNANLGAALFHPLLQLPQGSQQALLNQASIINQENNSTQAQTQQGSSSGQQQQNQSSSAFQGFNPQSQISQMMNGMNGNAGGQQISVGFLPLIGASNFTQVVPNQVLQNPHGLSTGGQDQHQGQNQNAGLNLLSQFVQKAKEQQDQQQQQQQNAQANAVQNFQQQVAPNLFYAPHLFNQTQFPNAAAMLSMQTQLPMQAQLPFAGNDLSSWNNSNGNDLSTNFLQQLMNLANGSAAAPNNQTTTIGDVSGNGNASLKNSPLSPKSSE